MSHQPTSPHRFFPYLLIRAAAHTLALMRHGSDFTGITSGDTFALGGIAYYNGITRIGTSSANALFDFYINLDSPTVSTLWLTTIKFGIDATINSPGSLIPDTFTASFTQPAP